jgi:LPXTG-motif cell wall-anchored protein
MRSTLKVLLLSTVAVLLLATPALAQQTDTYVDGEVTEVDPNTLVVDPADPGDPAVLGAQVERSENSSLPVTGGDAAALVMTGVVLLAAGGALVLYTRSRRETTSV